MRSNDFLEHIALADEEISAACMVIKILSNSPASTAVMTVSIVWTRLSLLPTAIAVQQFRKFSQCSTIAAMINAATRPPTIRYVILSFVSITLPSQPFENSIGFAPYLTVNTTAPVGSILHHARTFFLSSRNCFTPFSSIIHFWRVRVNCGHCGFSASRHPNRPSCSRQNVVRPSVRQGSLV
jgi:hypothetical protein